jgi:DsbC/DsbD-like thiol-disulfide interchange protein
MRMRAAFRALPFGLALLLWAAAALAEGTAIPHGTLELIAEKQWLPAGSAVDLGLYFQLDKGWHIYWIDPGDSGEPPRVEWQLPSGLTAGAIEWPAPQRFQTSSSIVDYGYVDSVLLIVPVHVNADAAARPAADIGAAVKLLICSHEMCVPGKAQLSLTLPIKSQPSPDARNADLFRAARKSLPQPAPANWKLSVLDTRDSSLVLKADFGRPAGGRQIVDAQTSDGVGHPITQAFFFPLAESQIENAAPQQLSLANGFQLTLRKSDQLLELIARLKGVLVFSGDSNHWEQSYSIDVPISFPAAVRKHPR